MKNTQYKRLKFVLAGATVLASTIVPGGLASAAGDVWQGKACPGHALLMSTGNGYWAGRADVQDSTFDRVNYSVAVSNLKVRRKVSTGYKTIVSSNDYDGYWMNSDLAQTPSMKPVRNYTYEVYVMRKWKKVSDGSTDQQLMRGPDTILA